MADAVSRLSRRHANSHSSLWHMYISPLAYISPCAGWFSGRRWARLRWNRSNWWRLRPKLLGGRRDGLVAAKLVPKAEADSTKGPDGALGPSALSFDARVRISGLEAESARGFNGLSARVKQWDEEEGRYVVEIDVSDNQRKLLSLKPEKVESL